MLEEDLETLLVKMDAVNLDKREKKGRLKKEEQGSGQVKLSENCWGHSQGTALAKQAHDH